MGCSGEDPALVLPLGLDLRDPPRWVKEKKRHGGTINERRRSEKSACCNGHVLEKGKAMETHKRSRVIGEGGTGREAAPSDAITRLHPSHLRPDARSRAHGSEPWRRRRCV